MPIPTVVTGGREREMEDLTLDLSDVRPAAREIVHAAAEIYARHTDAG